VGRLDSLGVGRLDSPGPVVGRLDSLVVGRLARLASGPLIRRCFRSHLNPKLSLTHR